jgi:putative DNA primase/helicase
MPDHSRNAAALWVMHSYLLDHALISPRLAIHSPTKQCGKTTLIDVLNHLVRKPLRADSVTPRALFRVVAKHHPTMLIDEADPSSTTMRS